MRTTTIAGCAMLAAMGAAIAQPAERSGSEIVKLQCSTCHATGLNGAPKIDDRAAWTPRMKNGVEATVRSAINGHGKMPSRGGMASVTDGELRNAILYMFYPAGEALKNAPAASPAAAPDPHRKVVAGMEVYLGISTADAKSGGGKGSYYVSITLRDSKTGAPIDNATVEARAATPVAGETKKLERTVTNGIPSYGNAFRMAGLDPYTISVQVRRPGTSTAAEARFDFKP